MTFDDFNNRIINEINKDLLSPLIILKNTKKLSSNKLALISNKKCKFKILGGIADIEKKPHYDRRITYSLSEIKQIVKELEAIEEELPNEKENKVIYIYDYLRKNIKYNPNERNDRKIRSLYSLVTRNAVCSGYALLLKELLDRQDIKSKYIKHLNHAWNIICINKKWYEVDLTWDACIYHKIPNSNIHYFANNKRLNEKHYKHLKLRNIYRNDILYEYNFTSFHFERDDKSEFDLALLPIGIDRKYYLYKEKDMKYIISSDDDLEAIMAEYDQNITRSYINCFFTEKRIKRNLNNNLSYIGYGYFKDNCFYRKCPIKMDNYITNINIDKNQITIESKDKIYIIKNNLLEVKDVKSS